MKDEIKEILDYLKPKYDIVDELGNDYKKVKFKDCKLLLDYITNLQEENERLKKRNKEIYDGFIATQEELSDYATRIDKAIRYIHKNYYEVVYKTKGTMENDLLNILNGGDEEC